MYSLIFYILCALALIIMNSIIINDINKLEDFDNKKIIKNLSIVQLVLCIAAIVLIVISILINKHYELSDTICYMVAGCFFISFIVALVNATELDKVDKTLNKMSIASGFICMFAAIWSGSIPYQRQMEKEFNDY